MVGGHVSNSAGYAGIAENLAQRALAIATDAAPHRERQGERRWALAGALPAARVLVDVATDEDLDAMAGAAKTLSEALADPTGKITDGFGHTRPSYALFAIQLLGSAARLAGDDAAMGQVQQAATTLLNREPATDEPLDPRLAVWCRLIARQHGLDQAETLPPPSDSPAPLIPLGLNDLIDSWTYYELVGLHGLHLCSQLETDDALQQRIRSAAEYHLGHTQPDYTTYQPWGLAAFASNPQTAVFAEQQLHDVATHLSLSGPGSAVMPALLLADAAATMAGTLTRIWR